MSSAYETLPITQWRYVRNVLHESESAKIHSVTKNFYIGTPWNAMKILSPSVDTNIMKTSLDEGHLYSLNKSKIEMYTQLMQHFFLIFW